MVFKCIIWFVENGCQPAFENEHICGYSLIVYFDNVSFPDVLRQFLVEFLCFDIVHQVFLTVEVAVSLKPQDFID